MTPEYRVGQRVCIAGVGVDLLAHRHATVERLTKTQIITRTAKGREDRFTRVEGRSIPYKPAGGTRLHHTCQRPDAQRERKAATDG